MVAERGLANAGGVFVREAERGPKPPAAGAGIATPEPARGAGDQSSRRMSQSESLL